MRAKQNGKYEITVSVKVTLDPVMVGFELSETDLLDEVQVALNTISYAERAELVARLH